MEIKYSTMVSICYFQNMRLYTYRCQECEEYIKGGSCLDCGLILQFSEEDAQIKRYPCYECVSKVFGINYYDSKDELLYHHKIWHCHHEILFHLCYMCRSGKRADSDTIWPNPCPQ